MLFLRMFLKVLNFIEAALSVLFYLIALAHYVHLKGQPLRKPIIFANHTFYTFIHALLFPPPLYSPHLATTPPPEILFKATFKRHDWIYNLLLLLLDDLPDDFPHELCDSLLRGNTFARLADSLASGQHSPELERLGVKIHPEVWARLVSLPDLPDLAVIAPEDGDREPQPGELGGAAVTFDRKLLMPPPRKTRTKTKGRKSRKIGLKRVSSA